MLDVAKDRDAAETLRSLRLVLTAFPAHTAQERASLAEWRAAVDRGISALLDRATAGNAWSS